MSVIVEKLYQPTEKDYLSGTIQRRFVEQINIAGAAAATLSGLGAIVPLNTICIVRMISCTSLPGAAQFSLGVLARVIDAGSPTNNPTTVYVPTPQEPVALRAFMAQECELVLFPGEQLSYQVFFNAGVAVNVAEVAAHGYYLPRANIQN